MSSYEYLIQTEIKKIKLLLIS